MQQTNDVWLWSEAFREVLERLLQEPQSDAMAHWDWLNRFELGLWRRQFDAARELYREGHAETLRTLCDYWRTIIDDVPEQVRFARESYHELSPSVREGNLPELWNVETQNPVTAEGVRARRYGA